MNLFDKRIIVSGLTVVALTKPLLKAIDVAGLFLNNWKLFPQFPISLWISLTKTICIIALTAGYSYILTKQIKGQQPLLVFYYLLKFKIKTVY